MIFPWGRLAASVLRPLRVDDAPDCARIHATGFAYPWSVAEMEGLIASATTIGSGGLEPGAARMRGFALTRIAADEAEILTIVVDPAYRKHGVGRDLVRAHLEAAAFAGATRIFLEVDAENVAALALYARFKFYKVGERRGYYKRADGAAATALVMRKDLRR
jgi:ribosomal-protein-alanine N-acetyltransferase